MRSRIGALVELAEQGLAGAGYRVGGLMAHTLRGVPGLTGPQLRPEGRSLRYTAIAALGLAGRPEAAQRAAFDGLGAAEAADRCLAAASESDDPGAWALALWAAGEVASTTDMAVAQQLLAALANPPVFTVDCSWAVVAGLAMPDSSVGHDLVQAGVALLLREQGARGTFRHRMPAGRSLRSHVGSFADQIYPAQALARYAARTGDLVALAAPRF